MSWASRSRVPSGLMSRYFWLEGWERDSTKVLSVRECKAVLRQKPS